MKIHYKLLLTFSIIAVLAGFVALYSYNATQQIIRSFEGGQEHFQNIIKEANEVGSSVKAAQSHLMLYLTLNEPVNREEFFKRYRTLLQQAASLGKIVRDREGRRIMREIDAGIDHLLEMALSVLQAYDASLRNPGYFEPAANDTLIRNFFAVSSKTMGMASELADLETDFLNKQFAIMNASSLNDLAKLTEGQLMLYMVLNDQRDLEKYMVGIGSLEGILARLKERVRDEPARNILTNIEKEFIAFKDSGRQLFEAFHGEQQRRGRLDLARYTEQINSFYQRSGRIRELGVTLSNLMTEQEFRKKEEALATASSIQRSVFFLVVVGGLLTILLGYVLSATVAKPIVELKEAALAIGRGDLDAAERVVTRGELGELAETFRTMGHDLKDARNELLASKEYTDNILRSMSDALCVIAPDGRIKTVNVALCSLMDYSTDELIGRQYAVLFHDDPPFVIEEGRLAEAVKSTPVVLPFRARNGQPVYVSFSSSLMYESDGRPLGIVCVAQDMTERRQAMMELRRMATVVDQAAEAIVVSDIDGKIQYVNPAFETITGYSKEDAIGRGISILKSGKHGPQFYRELWAALKKGKVWSGRFVNRRKDGSYYDEECTISPVYDDSRKVVNYVALKRDVTKESRLERQLQQSQKHQALGTLAGGIAHDFNNILSAIVAYAEGSLAVLSEYPEVAKNIREIVKASRRAADLVNQILTFSRPTKQTRKTSLLPPIIEGALQLVRGTMPSTIEIIPQLSADCRPVLVDDTQIHQVLVNLCTNAYHAMRDRGGKLLIALDEVNVSEVQGEEQKGLQPGAYARIIVQDTGCGIAADTLQRIFEPYFTTKSVGEGTGLGLAVAHGIVESHGGVIQVSSELGIGTTFEVYLPVHGEEEILEEKEVESDVSPLSGRVMFVDDEKIIAESMKIVLAQFGCTVRVFTSSNKALAVFRENPDEYDLVITDQTMPGLTGAEMSREMLAIRPDLPIILTTGFTETINEELSEEIGIRAFMMKPMVIDDLKKTVWRLLAEQKSGQQEEDLVEI